MKSRYHFDIPQEDPTQTRVERGTPVGEMLHRYWQPVCLSEKVARLPKRVRILCENLGTSDRGIALLRRALRRSLERMAAGGDPVNIVHDPAANLPIETHAWHTVRLPDLASQAAE